MKTGEVVVFVAGEYSDYGLSGVFKALKDFSLDDALEQFLYAYPKNRTEGYFDKFAFMTFLELGGFVEVFPVLHVSLGAYDNMPERSLEQEVHDLRKEFAPTRDQQPEFPPWGAGGMASSRHPEEAIHIMKKRERS